MVPPPGRSDSARPNSVPRRSENFCSFLPLVGVVFRAGHESTGYFSKKGGTSRLMGVENVASFLCELTSWDYNPL